MFDDCTCYISSTRLLLRSSIQVLLKLDSGSDGSHCREIIARLLTTIPSVRFRRCMGLHAAALLSKPEHIVAHKKRHVRR